MAHSKDKLLKKQEESVSEDVGFYRGGKSHGQRHGSGCYYFNNGARYIGDWKNGLKHGCGKFIYPDGSAYEGQWWENKKHGYGRYDYANGDCYDGQWQLNNRHGYGKYIIASTNNIYQGYWNQGLLTDRILIVMNGMIFSGYFDLDRAEGPGIFLLPNNLSVYGKHVTRGEKKAATWITKGIGPSF